jgi:hypothetical protein
MLTRRKAFLYKVEGTKGVDAAPVAPDDVIIPNGDLNISIPTEQDTGEGDLKSTFGPGESVTIKQAMSIEISTRVRGLGQGASALLVPSIHAMLMASGHDYNPTGDGSATPRAVVYTPTSVEASLKSATGYFYEDGLLYKLIQAANNLSFEASMTALMAKGTAQAGYLAPTVVAIPAISAQTEEVFRMTSTLCAVTDEGTPINIGSFTFDPGVDIQESYATGEHFFEVANRNPTLVIDPKAVATADDWNALTNATSVEIIATFTNSIGETLVFHFPRAVPSDMSSGDRAARITRGKTFSLKETATDDQYSITWTSVL